MLFTCGIFTRSASTADPRAAVAAAHAARRTAPAVAQSSGVFEGGALGHAQCEVERYAAGPVEACLWRPRGETRAGDRALLERCASALADSRDSAPHGLGGAFSLLLFDTRARRLRLYTDRFGICPVYYAADTAQLCFATDIEAVLAGASLSARLDPQAIYDYVFFHCIPAPRSIYAAVSKLPPASVLAWDDGVARVDPWWMPTFAASTADPVAAARDLRDALAEAVAARATPQCGAFLSGGLDSSSVTGMLTRHRPGAPTFTIGFAAEGYDESGYARIAASHFGSTHHEYFVTPDDVRASLGDIAAHCGEPFGNSSVIPTYHCARFARSHGVDLLLAGDGGDELFAGNTRYVDQDVFEFYFKVPGVLRGLLEATYRALPVLARLPLARKGARYIEQANMRLPNRLQSYNFLNRFDPAAVFDGAFLAQIDTGEPWRQWQARYAAPGDASALQRMLYLDWKFTLADNDLVKVSRMCSLAGIDVLYPMLDDAVVDLSTRLAAATLLEGGALRGFYKRAFGDFLPRAIIDKSKHGFGLPFGVWMRDDRGLQDLVDGAFAGMRKRGIFAGHFLDDALRMFREESAAAYYGELVWLITVLELWLEKHPC